MISEFGDSSIHFSDKDRKSPEKQADIKDDTIAQNVGKATGRISKVQAKLNYVFSKSNPNIYQVNPQIKNIKEIPPERKVKLNDNRVLNGNFGEPRGIDYDKLCSKIYQFFNRIFSRSSEKVPLDDVNATVSSKEVRTSKNSEMKLQVGTANVGMDAGLSQVRKDLEGAEQSLKKEDPTCIATNEKIERYHLSKNFNDLENTLKFLNLTNLENQPKKLRDFTDKLQSLLSSRDESIPLNQFVSNQRETLTELVGFLENLENRKILISAIPKEKITSIVGNQEQLVNQELLLNKLNQTIFDLYHFSMIQQEWESKKSDSSLLEYILEKESKAIDKRFEQIQHNDICFLQEFHDESKLGLKLIEAGNKIEVFSRSTQEPSLMINSERFEVQSLKGYEIKRAVQKGTMKFEDGKKVMLDGKNVFNPDVDLGFSTTTISVNGKEQTFKLYDSLRNPGISDNSFGTSEFKAIIAKDKQTGKKMLLCSVHIIGYEIGNVDSHIKVSKKVEVIRGMIEQIASDQGVDGIIMGGDFNSVKEKVGEAESPLDAFKKAKFTPVNVLGPTEVAVPSFFQKEFELPRLIDHFFIKWLGKEGKELIAAEAKVAALKSPLEQHQVVFDHEVLITEIHLRDAGKGITKFLKKYIPF